MEMSLPIKWDTPRIATSKEMDELERAGYEITILPSGNLLITPKELNNDRKE